MGWITFLSKDTVQKIELPTASEGGCGTELPVISIGVDDLDAAEAAIRIAGAEVVYGPVEEAWGLRRFCFVIQPEISSTLLIADVNSVEFITGPNSWP